MEKYLPNKKDIVCVTREERDFLITYFKNERSKAQKPKKEEEKSRKKLKVRKKGWLHYLGKMALILLENKVCILKH